MAMVAMRVTSWFKFPRSPAVALAGPAAAAQRRAQVVDSTSESGGTKAKLYLSMAWLAYLAERVGFEPTDPRGSPVFKTGALNHSTTSPFRDSHLANPASGCSPTPL